MIEQAKFTYTSLGKAFEEHLKTIRNQGGKQVKVPESLKFSNKMNELKQVEDTFSDNQQTTIKRV